MIHHITIASENPRRVGEALAEILPGKAVHMVPSDAHPFPSGTCLVFCGDEYGTSIDILPFQTELHPGDEVRDQFVKNPAASGFTATHAAVSVNTSIEHIEQIAAREGWRAIRTSRGGAYEVMEVWLENRVMLELLPPEFSAQYAEAMHPRNIDAIVQFFSTGSEPQ
jgi:hypothetical protein